jgi:hypothetical protein
MSQQKQKLKIPVIYYDEEDQGGGTNPIPYIPMEVGEDWPFILFIQEYRDTGEFEPDSDGNPQPICDMYMHKFVDMEYLKEKLDPATNDVIRVALGMEPLLKAQEKGAAILDKVYKAATKPQDKKGKK